MIPEYEYEQLRALEVLAGVFPKEIARLERMRQMAIAALGVSDSNKNEDLRLRIDEIDAQLARARYDFAMGEYEGDEE